MTTKPKVNPRKKKLDAICTKLVMFIVQETYTDEAMAAELLGGAILEITAATKLLVAADAEREEQPA